VRTASPPETAAIVHALALNDGRAVSVTSVELTATCHPLSSAAPQTDLLTAPLRWAPRCCPWAPSSGCCRYVVRGRGCTRARASRLSCALQTGWAETARLSRRLSSNGAVAGADGDAARAAAYVLLVFVLMVLELVLVLLMLMLMLLVLLMLLLMPSLSLLTFSARRRKSAKSKRAASSPRLRACGRCWAAHI